MKKSEGALRKCRVFFPFSRVKSECRQLVMLTPLHFVYFVIAVRAPKTRQAVKLSVFGNARPVYESERSPPLQKSTTFSRFSTVFAQNSTCLVQLFSTFFVRMEQMCLLFLILCGRMFVFSLINA